MCGIAGIVDLGGRRTVDRALLARMTGLLAHRGPDGDGFHLAPGIGLGHRRLAIIDLAGGAQPLYNEDGTVCVVFNGEIYNFQALAKELEACGHVFRTHCDTEVIVHAWEEWGADCVTRFRGMFAFALWDEARETLFLARDRLGIKPLYYADLGDGRLVFGSELKALLAHPALGRDLDPSAVEDYFAYGYVPDPKCIYAAVRKLAPGHVLTRTRGAPATAPRAYWDLPAFRPGTMGFDEAAEALTPLLEEAVRVRLISEVPLGAFLSGGVDSSAVVAMMAGASTTPVDACSIAFGEAGYDESAYAAEVARRHGARHHVDRVEVDAFDLLDRLATLYDEPFADSSAIPTYRVCELARRRVTVALSGDGGDEVFAGYRRYRWHDDEERVRRRLPPALRRTVFGTLGALYPDVPWAPRPFRAKATLAAIARDSAAAYFASIAVVGDGARARLFSPGFQRELQGYRALEVLAGHLARAPCDDPLSRVQYADFKTYLPGDILTKVDRASMAHSLEVRVPILDHELVAWAAGVPPAYKLRNGEGKAVFKRALEPYLPEEVLYRPKMGFAVPIAAWFRGPLRARVRAAVTGPTLAASGFFEPTELARLVEAHQSGAADHAPTLWALLMFEAFLRQVHEGAADTSDARALAPA